MLASFHAFRGVFLYGYIGPSTKRTKEEEDKMTKKLYYSHIGIVELILKLLEKNELDKLKKNKKNAYGSSIIMILRK